MKFLVDANVLSKTYEAANRSRVDWLRGTIRTGCQLRLSWGIRVRNSAARRRSSEKDFIGIKSLTAFQLVPSAVASGWRSCSLMLKQLECCRNDISLGCILAARIDAVHEACNFAA